MTDDEFEKLVPRMPDEDLKKLLTVEGYHQVLDKYEELYQAYQEHTMKIGTEKYNKLGAEAFRKLTAEPEPPFVVNICSECDKEFRDLIPEYICSTCRAQVKDDGAASS